MTTKPQSIDRDLVLVVGSQIMSGQLAGLRNPGGIDLDRLADLSVRSALALDAAIPRAEERLAAEAKAAEEAAIAAEAKVKVDAAAAAKHESEVAAAARAETAAAAKVASDAAKADAAEVKADAATERAARAPQHR